MILQIHRPFVKRGVQIILQVPKTVYFEKGSDRGGGNVPRRLASSGALGSVALGKMAEARIGRAVWARSQIRRRQMGGKKRRRTITGTHFVENRPVRQTTEAAPTNEIPQGRAYVKRMGWNPNPGVRLATTAKQVAVTVRDTALVDAVFFLDSSFIRGPLDEGVWEALMTRHVAITPWVDREIQDWMASPGHNVAHAAVVRQRLSDGHGHIIRVQPEDDYLRHGYKYYSALLLLRKLKGKQFALEFQGQHGRLPTPVEFFPAFKKLGRGYDDRAARMAWKGACDYDKKNYAADEQLVTMAVLHALMTGRETTILPRDHDLMDQFYKLIFLIDTHYRSMLLAKKYATSTATPTASALPSFGTNALIRSFSTSGCLSGGNIELFQPAMVNIRSASARSAVVPCCFIKGSAS